MPPGSTGARRKIILVALAALFAGIVAMLGLFGGVYATAVYAGHAKQIDWWLAGPFCAALFICASLATMFALMAGQVIASPAPLPADPPATLTVTSVLVRRQGRAHRWPKRSHTPRQLPERLSKFRGRTAELKELVAVHKRFRPSCLSRAVRLAPNFFKKGDRPARTNSKRPIIILINGMPGVGKTAVAQEFAHRVAKQFPDGQLYANLGITRERRTATDILQDFLKALGISEDEMPDDEYDRAHLFRSLTIGKRMIIFLDAARGYDQVDLLLPTSPSCTVIITCRTSLGSQLGAFEYFLKIPDTAEAVDLLRTYAGMEQGESVAETAAIVHYCGSLPLALRSAGEQISSGRFSAELLAKRLESPDNRLATLRYRARDIEDRISAEYDKLPPTEQRALRLLTLIESPTFGPWVIAPLMGVNTDEAESLAASLARYYLLMDAGRAASNGLPRYCVHPLVSLMAKRRLDESESPADQAGSLRELDSAYLEAARKILIQLEPVLANVITWHSSSAWTSCETTWIPGVMTNLDRWIGAEYRQLLRAITFAIAEQAWPLAWRIAAHLGACVADGLRPDDSLRAFDSAQMAAEREEDSRGRIEVLLAHGSFLAAVERYDKAFDKLDEAIRSTDTALPRISATVKPLLKMSAHRRKAEAWLQLGAYDEASKELNAASREAEVANVSSFELTEETARVTLLTAENDTWLHPRSWLDRRAYDEALATPPDDSSHFRAVLGLAEHARRQRRWDSAMSFYAEAYGENNSDARRTAAIEYRTARLVLQQGREGRSRNRVAAAHIAARHSGKAARIFHDMDDRIGVIRAKALLMRALLLAGFIQAASNLAQVLEGELHELGEPDPALQRMQARVQRCRAELMLALNEPDRASTLFANAIKSFEGDGDWRSAADTRVTLARALARRGRTGMAQAKLHEAEDRYLACGDRIALMAARKLRVKIARREWLRFWRERVIGH